jgi:hypothetical protein
MRRRPMPNQSKPVSRRLVFAAVAFACVSFGLTGASADVLPVTYTINGISGTNGWYRGNQYGNFVVVNWSINVPVIDSTNCGPTQVPGPSTGATRTCRVQLNDGTSVDTTTHPIKIDADPPTGIAAQLSRGPDYNGWYNHPVGASWTAADATSGLASCSSLTYTGPDLSGAQITGNCTDKAGNSTSASTVLNYDATAPVLQKVRVDSKASSNLLHWASTSSSDTVVVQRWARGNDKQQATLFRGSGAAFTDGKIAPGLEYNYAVQTFDQAGNASKRIVVAGLPKVLLLGKTGYVPRAAAKPILRWNRVHGAQYYNVQLYRGTKRVFAAWPVKNQLGLPAGWRWNGKRQRLSPGKYRWYVWAGFGARSFAHYQTVGSAQFIVPAR